MSDSEKTSSQAEQTAAPAQAPTPQAPGSPRARASVIHEGLPTQLPDIDPDETQDWIDSFDAMLDDRGRDRPRYVMLRLLERARQHSVGVPGLRSTDYINTIAPEREPCSPATRRPSAASVRSSAGTPRSWSPTPTARPRGRRPHRDVPVLRLALRGRLQPLLQGQGRPGGGDQVYIQGHAAPGVYARAYLEGRLSEEQLLRFRQEVQHGAGKGLSSYPHPRLMPEFWEFPTVSMGLTAINSIYQAASTATCRTAASRTPRSRTSGPSSATARWPSPSPWAPCGRGPRGARQPHLGHQLQPAAARRPGHRQRQDHPGARGQLPRGRLERHQGHLGPRVGRAARPRRRRRPGQRDEQHPGRPVPDLLGRGRRLQPRALLRAATRA